ncbi:MAG TPA: TrkA family potassium uptake protein [Bryobacteraceae bacterium]|nr:TrkA family potassium uptake protein [Bryobacteraceae bacterium]
MKVVIAGAGDVGQYLAHILLRSRHEVTLIEKNPACAQKAGEEAGLSVVRGDACEPSVLELAGIRGAEVVVAATGNDEDNLVVSNLAKFEFRVPQVVGRIKNAANAWLYGADLGVDIGVSAPHIISQLIEERVTLGDVVRLLKLEQGRIVLVEATLPPESPAAGKTVGDVSWPPDCVLVAILRGTHVVPATAVARMQPGDQILAIAGVDQVDALHRRLGTPARKSS